MARPKKHDGEIAAQDRLRASFLELVVKKDIRLVSIQELTERATCNRGTFYYYYADIFELLDDVLDRSIPDDLPKILLSMALSHQSEAAALDILAINQEIVDRACVLLNTSVAQAFRERVFKKAFIVWCKALSIDAEKLDPQVLSNERIVFEFVVNGVLGVLAYRGRLGLDQDCKTLFKALIPEIPDALGKCLLKYRLQY